MCIHTISMQQSTSRTRVTSVSMTGYQSNFLHILLYIPAQISSFLLECAEAGENSLLIQTEQLLSVFAPCNPCRRSSGLEHLRPLLRGLRILLHTDTTGPCRGQKLASVVPADRINWTASLDTLDLSSLSQVPDRD